MKKSIVSFFVLMFVLLSFSVSFSAQPPVPPEKKAEIIKLMKLTNGPNMAKKMKQRVIKALRDSFPDVPESYWKDLDKRIKSQQLLSLFIPIYAQYLSLEDLKQLVAFYQTPAGRHYLAAKEKMVMASAKEGKKWAMGWILQVFKELKAKGYKPKNELNRQEPGAKSK